MTNSGTNEQSEDLSIKSHRLELEIEIQKAFNRSQYDRTLSESGRRNQTLLMHMMEMDYFNQYGEEVNCGN